MIGYNNWTSIIKRPDSPSVWIVLGPVLLFGLLAILLPLLVRIGRRPPEDAWRGSFYANRDDPAVLVPKRFGFGYTLNFGNPWSLAVLALILLFVILAFALPIIWSNALVRHLPK
jgi:divalent metal cation (Fe/Co/Zn/Cd) transporter